MTLSVLVRFPKRFPNHCFGLRKNTFTFLLIAVSLELILGLALALALIEQKRFSNVIRAILLTPIFVTPVQ